MICTAEIEVLTNKTHDGYCIKAKQNLSFHMKQRLYIFKVCKQPKIANQFLFFSMSMTMYVKTVFMEKIIYINYIFLQKTLHYYFIYIVFHPFSQFWKIIAERWILLFPSFNFHFVTRHTSIKRTSGKVNQTNQLLWISTEVIQQCLRWVF